ncbi:MAG TPA: tetratricopeptide repeat protein, partial [Kofleriaceae bacterium]|nr:tetratricopeptide repeat protein [Kofleriaceae bacterium]
FAAPPPAVPANQPTFTPRGPLQSARAVRDAPPLPPPPEAPSPPRVRSDGEAEITAGILKPEASPSKKKLALFAGGGAALLLVIGVGVMLTRGGPAPTTAPPEPTPAPVVVAPPPEKPAPTPTPTPTPVAKPTEPAVPTEPAPPSEPAEPVAKPEAVVAAAPTAPRRRLGGKQVVLEYDNTPTSPTPPPPTAPVPVGEDPAVVARAREAYHRGNVKLFSGDPDGAVGAYRESLKIYPGYVAGYRGLGLAFAEQGNTPEALAALRTYAKTVPGAKDVPIIRKRIENLEKLK